MVSAVDEKVLLNALKGPLFESEDAVSNEIPGFGEPLWGSRGCHGSIHGRSEAFSFAKNPK